MFFRHNKLHRTTHYTQASSSTLEQAEDSIASRELPFRGIFYAIFTDKFRNNNTPTNSYDWWSVYSTIRNLSANWAPNFSLYNTVRSLSDSWNLGYEGYLNFLPVSGNYNYLRTNIFTNSADWNDTDIIASNIPREYTYSKTFSGKDLSYDIMDISEIDWNLNDAQAAFITLTKDSFLRNPTNLHNGGLYTLTIKQDSTPRILNFSSCYRFYRQGVGPIEPNNTVSENIINPVPNSITYITFVCNGTLMFGDVSYSGS